MSFVSFYDIYAILPEFYLFFSVCIILVFGVNLNSNQKLGYPNISFNSMILVSLVLSFSFLQCWTCPVLCLSSWNGLLINDLYTNSLKKIILLTILSWIILASFYTQKENLTFFEYWIIIVFAVLGILFILQVHDLLSMYLVIEFQSLTFYILVSSKRTSEYSTEAGLKYFILGAFSSALLLFGSSLLYSLTGLSNFSDLAKFSNGFYETDFLISNGLMTSLIFILIALLFKLGAAPFHMWSPDVYEGAPTSTTAFLVILPKISLLVLYLRLFNITFYNYFSGVEKIILICAVISLIVGALGALVQNKWKRFLAYSSINHIGFILLGIITGENSSIFSILFYIVSYIFMMLNIFVWIISCRTLRYNSNFQFRYLNQLNSLNQLNPVLTLTLFLTLLSMAGVPPLLGFFSKMFVLLNLIKNKIYGSGIIAILLSCVACFYYLRLIKLMYFLPSFKLLTLMPISKLNSILLGTSTFLLCLLWLDIELLTLFLQNIL